ncbi:hypothetical protein [Caballeronia grimmiae]|uniref:hypothetical protein n=1 Tax=Caballeronia grimmiae TaxID=1071679 RepID=UPI0038B960C9
MKVKKPAALSIGYTVVSVLRISAERSLSQVLARPSEWPELLSRLNEPAFFLPVARASSRSPSQIIDRNNDIAKNDVTLEPVPSYPARAALESTVFRPART